MLRLRPTSELTDQAVPSATAVALQKPSVNPRLPKRHPINGRQLALPHQALQLGLLRQPPAALPFVH